MTLIFNLHGRFGNHFYILSAMIYVIKKYNINCKLYIEPYCRDYYLFNVNKKYLDNYFEKYIIDELPENYTQLTIYDDKKLDLNNVILDNINTNETIFLCYSFFQTNKYFLQYKDDIKKLFIDETDNVLQYKNIINENDVFISVRRGDYFEYGFYVLNKDYYIDAYNKYFKGKNIYISSDDIDWCKKELTLDKFNKCNKVIYLENLDVLELYTIGSYFSNYICANSSFSGACELSSINYKKSIGVSNLSNIYYKENIFNDKCIRYNINDIKYKHYNENKNIKEEDIDNE